MSSTFYNFFAVTFSTISNSSSSSLYVLVFFCGAFLILSLALLVDNYYLSLVVTFLGAALIAFTLTSYFFGLQSKSDSSSSSSLHELSSSLFFIFFNFFGLLINFYFIPGYLPNLFHYYYYYLLSLFHIVKYYLYINILYIFILINVL
jgi:hypothetical protein